VTSLKAVMSSGKSLNLLLKIIEKEYTAKAMIQQNLVTFRKCMSTKSLENTRNKL